MHSSLGHQLILALPAVVTAVLLLLTLLERRALGAAAPPGLFARNGVAVGLYLLVAVALWTVVMIVLPLLYMIDLSFRPKLPPPRVGGPDDVYTLANYRYFLFGSSTSTASWNSVHLRAFFTTILASVLVTGLNLAIAYPLAFTIAQSRHPGRVRLLMLLLIAPYWVNEILRAFAIRIVLASQGLINSALQAGGIVAEPVDFLGSDVGLYAGLGYAYLLVMVFPLVSAISSLDRNQIEAARDLGAPWWRVHLEVVVPHAKPGIASGCTLVFMLCAGALATPLILGGPRSLWFTPIVYDRFYQAFNWQQGAAYALVLLLACVIFVLVTLRAFKVSLGEIGR